MSAVRSRTAIASAPLSATTTSAWPRSSSAVIAKMLRKSSSTTRIFSPSIALSSSPPQGSDRLPALRLGLVRLGRRPARPHRLERRSIRCRTRRQPWPQRRDELGRVDRLRNVVVRSGIEATLALAGRRLAGDGDDGQALEPIDASDRPDGLVSVHDRHHDVHQDDVDVGHPLERGECVGTALDDRDVGVTSLEERRHREDVADVVVDDEDLHAVDRAVLAPTQPVSFDRCLGVSDDRLLGSTGVGFVGSHGSTTARNSMVSTGFEM